MPIDMITLKLVNMLEEPSTMGTASALSFDPSGQSRTDQRIPPRSFTPVHPLPIVRTPMARDLCVPPTGGVTMGGERRLTRTGGRCGKHPTGFPTGPVPVVHPARRFLRVAPTRPGAQLHPGETIQATTSRLTPPGAGIIGPTTDCGVALVNTGFLGPGLTGPHHPTELREMVLDGALGWLDQGCDPQALASGAFARLVFPKPLLAAVASPAIPSRLLAFQGVAEARFVSIPGQSPPRPPCHEPLLTVLEDCAIRVQPQTVLGRGDAPGVRIDLGDGLVPPMQSEHREERRHGAALRCPCGGGRARVRLHAPCTYPRAYLPTDARWRWELCQSRRGIAAITTLRNVDLE
jgi:hypothetical protein